MFSNADKQRYRSAYQEWRGKCLSFSAKRYSVYSFSVGLLDG